MTSPSTPFKRILLPSDVAGGPTTGPDVIAVKIAVSRMGFWPWQEFDDVMNVRFAYGVKGKTTSGLSGFQRFAKIQADGRYGPATHKALLAARIPKGLPHAGEWAFDAHALQLYGDTEVQTKRAATVVSIFNWWQWMVDYTASIHYRQYRPMTDLARHYEPPKLPFDADCSSTFIYAAFLGGAISPDIAYGFSGYGNTDSLIRCGQRITESQIPAYAKEHYVGALYGSSEWATHHIVAVKNPGLVYSHGREEAPEKHTSIHYRSDLVGLRAYEVL